MRTLYEDVAELPDLNTLLEEHNLEWCRDEIIGVLVATDRIHEDYDSDEDNDVIIRALVGVQDDDLEEELDMDADCLDRFHSMVEKLKSTFGVEGESDSEQFDPSTFFEPPVFFEPDQFAKEGPVAECQRKLSEATLSATAARQQHTMEETHKHSERGKRAQRMKLHAQALETARELVKQLEKKLQNVKRKLDAGRSELTAAEKTHTEFEAEAKDQEETNETVAHEERSNVLAADAEVKRLTGKLAEVKREEELNKKIRAKKEELSKAMTEVSNRERETNRRKRQAEYLQKELLELEGRTDGTGIRWRVLLEGRTDGMRAGIRCEVASGAGESDEKRPEPPHEPPSMDDASCCVCLDAKKNCVFIPCGHVCCCEKDAKWIMEQDDSKCPICRKAPGKFMKIFL